MIDPTELLPFRMSNYELTSWIFAIATVTYSIAKDYFAVRRRRRSGEAADPGHGSMVKRRLGHPTD